MDRAPETIRVLHVDDERDFLDVTVAFLEREDDRFEVTSTTSTTRGLDSLAEGQFDCVVSDYDMPQRNGIEFLKAVRKAHPEIPFILYTGKGSEEIASTAISAGVTDYLQKSGGGDQYAVLANRIRNTVGKWYAEREAERTRTQLEAITQNSNDAILTIDAESTVRFVNRAVEELAGHSPDSLVGESLLQLMPPRYRDAHRDAVARYVETGDRTLNWKSVEFPVLHRDGHEVPVSVSFSEFEQDGERRFIGILRDISNRVRMEEELRERERQFRQLAENVQEVVWMTNPDKGEVFYVSPAYEVVWGRSVEPLYDDPSSFFDAIHPADRERVVDAVEAQPTGEYDEEYRIIRPNGDIRWIHDRAVPIENDAGEVYRIVGIASDTTERKEREKRLEEERAFNKIALESIVDFYWVLDLEERVIDWSDEDGSVTGYSADEAIGKRATEFFSESDQAYIVEKIGELREKGTATAEADFRTKDGTLVPYRFDGTTLTDSDGRVDRMGGFGQDISERVRRERQLSEEQKFTEQVINTLPDIFYVLETDGTLRRWNRRLAEVTGHSDEEIADTPVVEFFAEEDRQRVAEAMTEGLSGGQTLIKADIRTAAGERVPYELTGGRLQNTEGEVVGIVGIGRDISERNEYEENLERRNEQLEKFASIVSHDLRNPLNVAQGRLELAREECDDEDLAVVARAHDRMRMLIDDLLTLAREGKQVTDPEPVALDELVDDCWQNVQTADATLIVETDRTIRADRSRLAQLLENLTRNAVEHCGDEVTVTISDLDDGLYVADDGPGIPSDERERVFEAGYSMNRNGTGFGLAIVREIAEAHGWEVCITDCEDGGARFEITGVEVVE